MNKIAIVTATRAEYGLLTPLIRKIMEDKELGLELIVTGGHLAKKQGYTVDVIREDCFPIAYEIPILEDGNTPYDISLTIANAIRKFAECFRDDRPDMVVILGDRTEMLGVAIAAMNERIPIAHIHGGEITQGAIDDCIRHALTKMSYLHFTATEIYRKRVIQLGEEPERVFNVGSLGTENILKTPLLSKNKIRAEMEIPKEQPYVIVTFHPVTLEDMDPKELAGELCKAMEDMDQYYYIITKANADVGGDAVNGVFSEFIATHKNSVGVSSLGMIRYLSAVKYAAFVMGNSSSGIFEAPVLGTPSINIGNRQKGRIMSKTVICCGYDKESICRAMNLAKSIPRIRAMQFGDGLTSNRIVDIIKNLILNKNKIDLQKKFYNVFV